MTRPVGCESVATTGENDAVDSGVMAVPVDGQTAVTGRTEDGGREVGRGCRAAVTRCDVHRCVVSAAVWLRGPSGVGGLAAASGHGDVIVAVGAVSC